MDIETYLRAVADLSAECVERDIAPQDLIEKAGRSEELVADCVLFRSGLIYPAEEAELNGYLQMGFFREGDRAKRLGSFAFCFDLQHRVDLLDLTRQCATYAREQPLFRGDPDLFERIRKRRNGVPDLELIDSTGLKHEAASPVFKLRRGFGRLIPLLNPGVVGWAESEFAGAPKYVRLDPFWFHETQPPQLLTEATLVPANPRWLGDLSLHRGMKEFAAYLLQDVSSKSDPLGYLDYRMRRIRRLEVYAKRWNDGHLSMMLEELPSPDAENEIMIGRCVHLDTDDPAGTPLRLVHTAHLDLAINVYCGDDRKLRFSQTLQQGKVQDATFRTHLFRIEGAPLHSMFAFCEMFFRSRVLLREWVDELALNS